MSLYLPEQKLGSHSQEDSSSHKFMLKGRQTGAMHRGHSWVFRAESHETMISWYEDIESLISKTGEARNAFVRRHVRSVSGRSVNSAMEDDEADQTPYSAGSAVLPPERPTSATRQPGGAFPSDVQIDRKPQAPQSPSSNESSFGRDVVAAAGAYPDGTTAQPSNSQYYSREGDNAGPSSRPQTQNQSQSRISRHDSYYGDWIGPAAVVNKQKQSQQSDQYPTQGPADDREIRSDGGMYSAVAKTGVVDGTERRDRSAPPYAAHRESVSTAPTNTNFTDYTNNTMATTVDDGQDSGVAGVESDASKGHETGIGEEGSGSEGLGAGGTGKSGSGLYRPKQDSIVAIDMRIPGRFPPTNVAA